MDNEIYKNIFFFNSSIWKLQYTKWYIQILAYPYTNYVTAQTVILFIFIIVFLFL